jgi:hypothetical protein
VLDHVSGDFDVESRACQPGNPTIQVPDIELIGLPVHAGDLHRVHIDDVVTCGRYPCGQRAAAPTGDPGRRGPRRGDASARMISTRRHCCSTIYVHRSATGRDEAAAFDGF